MSTEGTPAEDLTVETEQDDDLVKRLRAQIREEREGRVSLERTLAEKTKAETFKELGIDIGQGPGKLLYEHYEGEVTPEAVKTAAEGYSIPVGTSAPTPTIGTNEGTPPSRGPVEHPDAAQHRERNTVGSDGGATDALPTGREQAQSKYEEMVNAGRTNEEAMAGYFSSLFEQAVETRQRGSA